MTAPVIEVDTPYGAARVHLHAAQVQPVGALILGHGANGAVGARDLVCATDVAVALGFVTALVEQPYKVAGKRSPAPATQLDTAWLAVVTALRGGELDGLPVIAGGRSSGARVACRTAAQTQAIGVLCLAFPLHPPGKPDKTRQPELDAVRVPTLIVQGESDPFGLPARGRNRKVVTVRGNHSLSRDLNGVAAAVRGWLVRMTATRTGAPRSTLSFAALRAGKIAAMMPADDRGDHEHDQRAPGDRERRVLDRSPTMQRRADPEQDPEHAAEQRGDDALVADHPPQLAAAHPDRAQHPELPRALEHRQHQRVDDPEQADDDRQRQQHVEEVQELSSPLSWLALNWDLVWTLASGNAVERRIEPVGVGCRSRRPTMFTNVYRFCGFW